jgi:hypothetical protein
LYVGEHFYSKNGKQGFEDKFKKFIDCKEKKLKKVKENIDNKKKKNKNDEEENEDVKVEKEDV